MSWTDLIAQLVAEGIEGGSWEGVRRNVTLPRLRALNKYWAKHPPASWIAAAQIGLKPTPKPANANAPSTRTSDPKNLGGLLAAFGVAPGTKAKVTM